jgi:DNA-3-methyladenine glycosylase II
MPHFIHTETDLRTGVAALIELDPRMRAVFEVAGHPPLRKRSGGFPGLAAIVVSQQVSTASAAAIWGRLAEAFDPFHHDAVRRARSDRLARLGLSAPKIRTMKAIARSVATGALDLDALTTHGADEAHAALVAVHGIGPWTADVYLLFCLGHADAFPAGDLALQEAMKIAFNLKTRPSTKEAIALAEGWRPWRGAAACLLWSYYRAVKGRSGTPVATAAPNRAVKKDPAKKPRAKKAKARSK